MKRLRLLSALAAVFFATAFATDDTVVKHEKGRCSMRGHCGTEGAWGFKQLPCPDNGQAKKPEDDARKRLVEVCGDKWRDSDVCCNGEQIEALSSNLKRADALIGSCPACQENFYNLFCTFTCSPDQSLFVNVTDTTTSGSTGKTVVTELDNLWSDKYGTGFYNSCKEVKVGGTGGKAINLIGGGAKNYSELLSYLGKKSPLLGSPFQINFPSPKGRQKDGMKPSDPVVRSCSDENYRCACVDCPASCAELPEISKEQYCHVGKLPCLSFASVLIYSVFILLVITAIAGHIAYRKHARRRDERLRLLQDSAPSDDEDEGDVVQGAGMLDRPQRPYRLSSLCDTAFTRLGGLCARFPFITIGTSVLVVILLSLGWINFEVEKDPVRLWVSPSSATAQEKEFFDKEFGPFYRAEQAFLVNDSNPDGPAPILSYETLEWWFDVEHSIRTMSEDGITLDDVCFKPTGDACVVQSLTGYFQGDFSALKPDSWQKSLGKCLEAPVDCLPEFQQPLERNLLLGGYDEDDLLNARAMVVTWVVSNHAKGSAEEKRAMLWEEQLINKLLDVQKEAESRGLRLSFKTEISLEEELSQTTNTDATIVVVSYIIMFIYASIALGSTSLSLKALMNNPSSALVQSKFSLGISGIVIVLMSVSASVGLFSAAGVKVTLIIAEVIPFLVLAVGVDNIFLIVHEFERVNQKFPDEEIDSRMAKALGRMGPSILLSGLTETVTFVLGVFVAMPAVKNFAAYAAGAVFINALLQVTMFVSVLTLNQRRVESNRVDCFPFIKMKHHGRMRSVSFGSEDEEGPLQRFIRKYYAPALLNRQVKAVVSVLFLGIFAAGVALIPEMSLGLDQRIAIPTGSYLIPYFNDLYAYLNTGPPVYFVTRGVNATARVEQQELCSRFTTCDPYSLANVLELESQRSNVSYITGATANWLDDFLFWLNPALDECCIEHGDVCFEDRDPSWNVTLYGMPEGEEFVHYISKWLKAPTNSDCSLGGQAAYSSAVVVDANSTSIPASSFRTSHTPLRSQDDFISAYASARRIADDISDRQGIDVFPYSVFYIFFDQYASIVDLTGALLGAAAGLILIITSVLLGSLVTGAIVTMTVVMIVVDVLGTMVLAGVSLNAVSLVNLVICVGIGVEFCAHIARAFTFPSRSVMEKARSKFRGRDARAWSALVNVGGSVFTGITITKLLGVCVLAFTRSKIFEVYYFRVWLALVIWAALHALVFLPIVLSLIGGEGRCSLTLFESIQTNAG